MCTAHTRSGAGRRAHLEAQQQLRGEEADHLLAEGLVEVQQVVLQVAARLELQHKEHLLLVLEGVLQARDERVVHAGEHVALVDDHARRVARLNHALVHALDGVQLARVEHLRREHPAVAAAAQRLRRVGRSEVRWEKRGT
jgi:predicted protein tyrosine phosphatase